jgi:hypothetical protein
LNKKAVQGRRARPALPGLYSTRSAIRANNSGENREKAGEISQKSRLEAGFFVAGKTVS